MKHLLSALLTLATLVGLLSFGCVRRRCDARSGA